MAVMKVDLKAVQMVVMTDKKWELLRAALMVDWRAQMMAG